LRAARTCRAYYQIKVGKDSISVEVHTLLYKTLKLEPGRGKAIGFYAKRLQQNKND